jgi:hypothetical protein
MADELKYPLTTTRLIKLLNNVCNDANDAYDKILVHIPKHISSSMTFNSKDNKNKNKQSVRLPRYRNAEIESVAALERGDFDTYYNEQVIKTLRRNNILSYVYEIEPPTFADALPLKKGKKSPSPSPEQKKVQSKKIKDTVVNNMLQAYPFNLFNFKTRDECKSSSRSKPYYINKTDILDIIGKDENLVKAFPKGYKKLSKSDICDVFFETKKW